MMRVLETTYSGRTIVLECTHKRAFPPPQMYGATPEDVDVLWKQGALTPTQYQLLKTWQERCGLMLMGPRCLGCPLALKQNPRPGRPNVIETEPWLAAKKRIHWENMKNNASAAVDPKEPEEPDEFEPEEPEPEELEEPEEFEPEEEALEEPEGNSVPAAAVVVEATILEDDAPAGDQDIIDALAQD